MKKSNTLSIKEITSIGDNVSIMVAAQAHLINKDVDTLHGLMLTQIIAESTYTILDILSPVYTFNENFGDKLLSEKLIHRIDKLEWKIQGGNMKVNPSE